MIYFLPEIDYRRCTNLFKLHLSLRLMNKNGLNEVVTTVLLILIIIAAVGIIWVFVNAAISRTTGSFDTGTITASFSVVPASVKINSLLQYMLFSVQRNSGEGEVNALNIIIEDSTGTTKTFRQIFSQPLQEFEKQQVLVSWRGSGLNNNIKSISIVPTVITENKKELLGKTTDVYKINGFEDSGLVAYWDFEGGFGDRTGKNTFITPNGGIVTGADTTNTRTGSVATFDGNDDYIEVGDQDFLDFDSGSFTIAFWARPDTSGGTSFSSGRKVLDKTTGTLSKGYQTLFISSGTELRISPTVSDNILSPPPQPQYTTTDSEWRFYVFIIDHESTNKILRYVFNKDDLQTVILRTGSEDLASLKSTSNDVPLVIGSNQAHASANTFKGKLDDIMVFNRALSANEVNFVYNATRQS